MKEENSIERKTMVWLTFTCSTLTEFVGGYKFKMEKSMFNDGNLNAVASDVLKSVLNSHAVEPVPIGTVFEVTGHYQHKAIAKMTLILTKAGLKNPDFSLEMPNPYSGYRSAKRQQMQGGHIVQRLGLEVKFAWLPTIIRTGSNRRALIWFKSYVKRLGGGVEPTHYNAPNIAWTPNWWTIEWRTDK
tara:strand:- start:279 stop:839 length:561 start_codon:yes stop_codon:yes gene_type:complete